MNKVNENLIKKFSTIHKKKLKNFRSEDSNPSNEAIQEEEKKKILFSKLKQTELPKNKKENKQNILKMFISSLGKTVLQKIQKAPVIQNDQIISSKNPKLIFEKEANESRSLLDILKSHTLQTDQETKYIDNLLKKTIVYTKSKKKMDKQYRRIMNIQRRFINKQIRDQQRHYQNLENNQQEKVSSQTDSFFDNIRQKFLKLSKKKSKSLNDNFNGIHNFPAFKILSQGLLNKTFEISQQITQMVGQTIVQGTQKNPIQILLEFEEKRKQVFSNLISKIIPQSFKKYSKNLQNETLQNQQSENDQTQSLLDEQQQTQQILFLNKDQLIPEGFDIKKTIQYQEALQYEAVILETHANKVNHDSNIYQFDTQIEIDGKQEHLHTLMTGEKNDKDIVLFHGFGGSGLTFYRMIPALSQHFRVWCVDFLGMGMSSRPLYSSRPAQQAVNFFLDPIEQWRIQNNIDDFYLVGHSLGGSLATYYASMFPNKVKQLFLLSPVGFVEKGSTWLEQRLRDSSFAYRLQFALLSHFYKHKYTCSSIRRKLGKIIKEFIRQYTLTQFEPKLSILEAAMFTEYFDRVNQLPESSQIGLYDILEVPSTASQLEMKDCMKKINNIQTHMFFGDRDWVNIEGPIKMCSLDEINADVTLIENCGHQLEIEKGEEIAQKIIEYINNNPDYN